ncbi:MAG: hypothetical protein ACE5EZ_00205 [Thermodesulfobacteriota bacterium]
MENILSRSFKVSAVPLFLMLFFVALMAGCGPYTKGAVEEDISRTRESDRLEKQGLDYRGPSYNVAIIAFRDKTPGKALGVADAATEILRTIVKRAGLEPIVLTEEDLSEQASLSALQDTGVLKKGKKDVLAGYESVDFRISGAVTSYSTVEESTNVLLAQSKTVISRVQVDYALVDVETGKSLLAESGAGEYRKTTGGLLGLGSRSTFDMSLRDGALRDALTKAMTSMAEKLNAMPFRGRVLAVEGQTLYVRAGTKSRLSTGTVFSVYRYGKELVDPDTGRVIGRTEQKVGEAVLSTHQDENISRALIKTGSGFKAGDVIRTSSGAAG